MADGGARLFIVGFESGDPQILKNIKKGRDGRDGAQLHEELPQGVGIKVHGDFIIGLPGETKETIQKTIDFAKELDCETIQVFTGACHAGNGIARYHGAAGAS